MYKHIFGPVPSRRLGMSLGIDLVPHKVCSLNCIYCECGHTTNLTIERREYIKVSEALRELDDYLSSNPAPDFITFSGAGEPTLNSRIGEVLTYIKKNHEDIKTALLTNGTLLNDAGLRKELLPVDIMLPSLDAATPGAFKRINRPAKNLDLKSYLQGLLDFSEEYKGEIWLEVFILPGYNDDTENLESIKSIIHQMKAERVQLNTLDRPGAKENLSPASKAQLEKILLFFDYPKCEIISKPLKRKDVKSYRGDTETAILETIQRRPCTPDDLSNILGMHINEINKYLSVLEGENKIETIHMERGIFYKKS